MKERGGKRESRGKGKLEVFFHFSLTLVRRFRICLEKISTVHKFFIGKDAGTDAVVADFLNEL